VYHKPLGYRYKKYRIETACHLVIFWSTRIQGFMVQQINYGLVIKIAEFAPGFVSADRSLGEHEPFSDL